MATELATRPPAFVDGKTLSANDLRLNVLSGSGGATPLQSRAGVRPSGGNPGLVAALATPVMKVRVNAGIADVPSSSVTGGFYRVSWDQVDLDIDPSSAAARTDLIIVEVVDTGTSAATGKVRVLKGTSGGGRPTNGVVNAHWFTLAATAVRVNAEGTGNIRPQDVTPELQYAVAPGGRIPFPTSAAAAATTGSWIGEPGVDIQTKRQLYWDGAKWVKSAGPREVALSNGNTGVSGLIGPGTAATNVAGGNFTMPVAADTVHVHAVMGFKASTSTIGTFVLTVGGVSFTQSVDTGGHSTPLAVPVPIAMPLSLAAGSVAWTFDISNSAGGNANMQYGAIRVTF